MASDSPVDNVHNVADTDEADRCDEEIEEVEAIVRRVGGLNHSLIEVVKYHSNI